MNFSMLTRLVLLLFNIIIFLAGCAVNRSTGTIDYGSDITKIRNIYMKTIPEDDDVYKLIREALRQRGFAVLVDRESKSTSNTTQTYENITRPASSLPVPTDTDAIITYYDKWQWDITMYLLKLSIQFIDPKSNQVIADGYALHTSLTRRNPQEMVDEVLTNIFSAVKPRVTIN